MNYNYYRYRLILTLLLQLIYRAFAYVRPVVLFLVNFNVITALFFILRDFTLIYGEER